MAETYLIEEGSDTVEAFCLREGIWGHQTGPRLKQWRKPLLEPFVYPHPADPAWLWRAARKRRLI